VPQSDAFLDSVRYQLHLTQLIKINPGQGAQLLHRDRQVWGSYLKDLEPELNLMWAMTDFSKENGATRVVPGSHTWKDWDRAPTDDEIAFAEMKKGSLLFYSGSVIHSGGQNETDKPRIGFNIDYSLGWLRMEVREARLGPFEAKLTGSCTSRRTNI
jgi:ectoine hydroxylase-related dioxygenase (phytanoyl-CoA dioxygenase family)